jgi:hypothetical protein
MEVPEARRLEFFCFNDPRYRHIPVRKSAG